MNNPTFGGQQLLAVPFFQDAFSWNRGTFSPSATLPANSPGSNGLIEQPWSYTTAGLGPGTGSQSITETSSGMTMRYTNWDGTCGLCPAYTWHALTNYFNEPIANKYGRYEMTVTLPDVTTVARSIKIESIMGVSAVTSDDSQWGDMYFALVEQTGYSQPTQYYFSWAYNSSSAGLVACCTPDGALPGPGTYQLRVMQDPSYGFQVYINNVLWQSIPYPTTPYFPATGTGMVQISMNAIPGDVSGPTNPWITLSNYRAFINSDAQITSSSFSAGTTRPKLLAGDAWTGTTSGSNNTYLRYSLDSGGWTTFDNGPPSGGSQLSITPFTNMQYQAETTGDVSTATYNALNGVAFGYYNAPDLNLTQVAGQSVTGNGQVITLTSNPASFSATASDTSVGYYSLDGGSWVSTGTGSGGTITGSVPLTTGLHTLCLLAQGSYPGGGVYNTTNCPSAGSSGAPTGVTWVQINVPVACPNYGGSIPIQCWAQTDWSGGPGQANWPGTASSNAFQTVNIPAKYNQANLLTLPFFNDSFQNSRGIVGNFGPGGSGSYPQNSTADLPWSMTVGCQIDCTPYSSSGATFNWNEGGSGQALWPSGWNIPYDGNGGGNYIIQSMGTSLGVSATNLSAMEQVTFGFLTPLSTPNSWAFEQLIFYDSGANAITTMWFKEQSDGSNNVSYSVHRAAWKPANGPTWNTGDVTIANNVSAGPHQFQIIQYFDGSGTMHWEYLMDGSGLSDIVPPQDFWSGSTNLTADINVDYANASGSCCGSVTGYIQNFKAYLANQSLITSSNFTAGTGRPKILAGVNWAGTSPGGDATDLAWVTDGTDHGNFTSGSVPSGGTTLGNTVFNTMNYRAYLTGNPTAGTANTLSGIAFGYYNAPDANLTQLAGQSISTNGQTVWTNQANPAFLATTSNGNAGYVAVDGSAWSYMGSGTSGSLSGNTGSLGDGAHTVCVLNQGQYPNGGSYNTFNCPSLGNQGSPIGVTYATVLVDTTPGATTITPGGTAGTAPWWISSTISLSCADSGTGCNRLYYNVDDGSGGASTAPGAPWTLYSGPFALPNGVHTVYAYSVDNVGNVEAPKALTVNVDGLAPNTPAAPTAGIANATTASVSWAAVADNGASGMGTYQIWAHDNSSGADTYSASTLACCSTTMGGLSPGDRYVFYARAFDVAGNVSAWSSASAQLILDNIPPTTTISPGGTAGSNGWWITSSVTLSCTDNVGGSGCKQTFYNIDNGAGGPWTTYSGTFAVPGDGVHTVYGYSVDNAGNVEAPPKSQTIKVDATSPTSNATFGGTTGPVANDYRSAVSVTVTAADATSGVSTAQYSINGGGWVNIAPGGSFTVSSEGTYSVRTRAIDNAGNTSSAVSYAAFIVDLTAPVSTISLSGTMGQSGYYRSTVTATISCTDALSGVNKLEYALDSGAWTALANGGTVGISSNGSHTLQSRCTDNAGNLEAAHNPATGVTGSGTIVIDLTPISPGTLVQWIGGQTAVLNPGTGVHLTWTAPAAIGPSGVWYYTVNIGPPSSGPNGAYVNNTNVGNALALDWAPDFRVVPSGLKQWTVTVYNNAGASVTYTPDTFNLQLQVYTPPTFTDTVTQAGTAANANGFYWPLGKPGYFQLSGTVSSEGTVSNWTPTGYTAPQNGTTTFTSIDFNGRTGLPVPYQTTQVESQWTQPGQKTLAWVAHYQTVYNTQPQPTTVTGTVSLSVPITMAFGRLTR